MKPKILVIVGSTREGRSGRKVADWYMEQVSSRDDAEFELLDAAELNLSLFNEPIPPMMHQYGARQTELAAIIGAADGFVFVTPEYNHSFPASLKNLIDYIAAEWGHKAVAYVGYGVSGAVSAIDQLVSVMTQLRAVSVTDRVLISNIWEALDENGVPKDAFQRGNIDTQVKELLWWVNALKAARG
jgi:NAD(P)H-dependent FMN reductase